MYTLTAFWSSSMYFFENYKLIGRYTVGILVPTSPKYIIFGNHYNVNLR